MSIEMIGRNIAYSTAQAGENAKNTTQFTTVTTHCDKKHAHDQSCSHSVSTKPAPRVGEAGYLLDKTA